jgi:hypothetical protein
LCSSKPTGKTERVISNKADMIDPFGDKQTSRHHRSESNLEVLENSDLGRFIFLDFISNSWIHDADR